MCEPGIAGIVGTVVAFSEAEIEAWIEASICLRCSAKELALSQSFQHSKFDLSPFSKKLGAFRRNLEFFAGNLTHSFGKWQFLPEN